MLKNCCLPDELSKLLVCFNCKSYLSSFPIFINEKNHSFCGRCTQKSDELIRNDVYENVIKMVRFPCSNDKHGCCQFLAPSEVADHEKYCEYAVRNCPDNDCEWKGFINDLLSHWEVKHQKSILQNAQLKLDFDCNKNTVHLLPYQNELFVVKCVLNVNNNEEYNFTVEYLGCNRECEKYKFTTHVLVEEVSSKLNLFETFKTSMHKILDKPTSKTMQIKLQRDGLEDEKNDIKYNINAGLFKELECPVCLEYLTPPVYQCDGGHSFCKSCRQKMKNCSVCTKNIYETQKVLLEKITKYLSFPCKFKNCLFVGKLNHKDDCIYRPYKCRLVNCSWNASLIGFQNHAIKKHNGSIFKNGKIMVSKIDSTQTHGLASFCKLGSQFFQLTEDYNSSTKELSWCLQVLEDFQMYKFELEILDPTDNKMRLCFVGQCSPVCKNYETDKRCKNYKIHFEQIKELIKEGKFRSRYTIFIEQ